MGPKKNAAKKTIKRMIAAAISMAVILSTTFVSSAGAWDNYVHGEHHTWGSDEVRYCFDPDWYDGPVDSTRQETVEHAVYNLNNASFSALHLSQVAYNNPWPFDCNIHLHWQSFSAHNWDPDPAKTVDAWNERLGLLTRSDIYYNSDFAIRTNTWWSEDVQLNSNGATCKIGGGLVTGCGKGIDFLTAMRHEFGHSVGIGHNTAEVVYCSSGYLVTATANACTNDFYSTDPMYWAAADGYRRNYQQDTENALEALYPCC